METLKGIFSMPKMERNRRNFLRENKLSLRELQQVTNKNRLQKEQEQQMRQQRYAGRRALSQQRNGNSSNNLNAAAQEKPTAYRYAPLPSVPNKRSVAGSVVVGDGHNNQHQHNRPRSVSRTNSNMTIKSVHKQVQTEEIQDEQFLYDALKRCSSNASHSRYNGLQPNHSPRSNRSAFDGQSRTSFYPTATPPTQLPPSLTQDDEEYDEHQQQQQHHQLQQHQQQHHQQQNHQQQHHQQHGFENSDDNIYTARQQQQAHSIPQQYERYDNGGQKRHYNNDGRQQQQQVDESREENETATSRHPTPRSHQHYTNGYNMVDSGGDMPALTIMQSSYEPPAQHGQQQQQQQMQPVHYRMQPHVQNDDMRHTFENMSLHNDAKGAAADGAAGDGTEVGISRGCGDGIVGADIEPDLDNYVANDIQHGGVADAASISGRSRHTNFSHSTQQSNAILTKKRSTGSIHKLGSRDNLSLPRYLEREKREKEQERLRQSERDPNCPPGHYALSNKERLAALQTAETRFEALVSELNHMPMTTETLRMRLRKAEIEKELKLLETDIRVFSKTKVYVKPKD